MSLKNHEPVGLTSHCQENVHSKEYNMSFDNFELQPILATRSTRTNKAIYIGVEQYLNTVNVGSSERSETCSTYTRIAIETYRKKIKRQLITLHPCLEQSFRWKHD
jgi:hypothetical protein